MAGVGVLAAPAVVLGVSLALYYKNKKLYEVKEIVYKNALAKQQAIINALKNERNADKERIEYLTSLNTLLQAAINDLKHDFDNAA